MIRRAVTREDFHGQQLKSPPKWLKIWIKDKTRQGNEVRLNLAVALIDFLILKAEEKEKVKLCSQKTDDDFSFLKNKEWMKNQVKFADIWRELKKMEPGYIMELKDEASFVRIWLE